MENYSENTHTVAEEKPLSTSGSNDEDNSLTSVSGNGLSVTALEYIGADIQNKEYEFKRMSSSDDEDALTDLDKLFCEENFQSHDKCEKNPGEVLDLKIDSISIPGNCDEKLVLEKIKTPDEFLVKAYALNFISDEFLIQTTTEIDNGNNSVNQGDLTDLVENSNEKCEETTEKVEKIENISSCTKIDDLLFTIFQDSSPVLTPANTVKEFKETSSDDQFTQLSFQIPSEKNTCCRRSPLPNFVEKLDNGIFFKSDEPEKDNSPLISDSEEYLENTFFVMLSEENTGSHEVILSVNNLEYEHSELHPEIVHTDKMIDAKISNLDDASRNANKLYKELRVAECKAMEENEICQNDVLGDIYEEAKFSTYQEIQDANRCEPYCKTLKLAVNLPKVNEIKMHLEKTGLDDANTIYSIGSSCEMSPSIKTKKKQENGEKDIGIPVSQHAEAKHIANIKNFSVKKWKNVVENAFRSNRLKSYKNRSPTIKEAEQNVSPQIFSTYLKEKDECTSKNFPDNNDSISIESKPLKGILKKNLPETSNETSQHTTSPKKLRKQKNAIFLRFFKRKVQTAPSLTGQGTGAKICANAELKVDDANRKIDPEQSKKTLPKDGNKSSDTTKIVNFSSDVSLLIYSQEQKTTDPMEILKVRIKDLKKSSDDSLGNVISDINLGSEENNLSDKVKVSTPRKIKKFFTQTLRKPFKSLSPKKRRGKDTKGNNLMPATENYSFDTSLDISKAEKSDNIDVSMVSSSESSDMQEDSEEFVSKFALLEESSSASEFSNQPSNSDEIHNKKNSKRMKSKFSIKSIFISKAKKRSKK